MINQVAVNKVYSNIRSSAKEERNLFLDWVAISKLCSKIGKLVIITNVRSFLALAAMAKSLRPSSSLRVSAWQSRKWITSSMTKPIAREFYEKSLF